MNRSLSMFMLGALLCTGCAHRMGANKFPVVEDKEELKAVKADVTRYRAKPSEVTKAVRNNLIERLVGVSDDHYIRLRNELLKSRNAISFAGEVAATTLSAVSALLGDLDTKSMLSTASTLTQSTKTSLDKNFFRSTSSEALVAKMDALRAVARQTMIQNEQEELDTYSLEAAFNDVRQYDDAGTLEAALVAISSESGSQKQKAEGKLQEYRESLR